MPQSRTGQKILAWATLGLCILAYARPAFSAWWWVVLVGAALAVAVFLRALGERKAMLAGRLSAFVAAELMLPVLVMLAGLVATIAGDGVWLDVAIVLAVALACVSLL